LKTVQMTLDEDLIKVVDQTAKRLGTTRSSFTRKALREALRKLAVTKLELRHRKGYQAYPVTEGEFSVWEQEQQWGDE
jgi:metal-responsive CopG/Arc/MetJ family transcriptional regulator